MRAAYLDLLERALKDAVSNIWLTSERGAIKFGVRYQTLYKSLMPKEGAIYISGRDVVLRKYPVKAMNATILVVILLAVSIPAVSQKPDSTDGTIFVGRHFSFVLKEPNGWTMNSETLKSQGVEAVLYAAGSSWKNAVAVMYARVIHKDEAQSTIEKVISNDIADFLQLSKESTVSDSPALETRDKRKSISKVFYDAANKNYEMVTFIDEPKVVVILALSSRQKAEYEKALPAFKALVSSYFVFSPLVSP